jgi:2-succinyl-6-hydroxy-2,4-cyclohexadiene-1-carboxylate synthase
VILSAAVDNGQPGYPWLVFLHGFSGDRNEWRKVGDAFPAWPRLYLDLPGHGGSADIAVQDFAGVNTLLQATLNSYNILKYWLIGYSLGGRVAMNFACQPRAGLRGLIVEGGHPGLQDADARNARLASDRRWATRFRTEPLEKVFADWYQQPVFASLTDAQRDALITLRSQNNGATLAMMLEATSLAGQPDLRPALSTRHFSFDYLYGERDKKFAALAAELHAVRHAIPNAGHNAHRENPAAVIASLAQILRYRIKDTL